MKKNEKIRRKKKPKPWTLKVTLSPSGVLLVSIVLTVRVFFFSVEEACPASGATSLPVAKHS